MSDMVDTMPRRFLARAKAVHIVAAAAAAVLGCWVAVGSPIATTRGYVQSQVAGLRQETIETRADLVDLRIFMTDWTLRQGATLDPQSRSLIEAERARLASSRASLQLRLDQARAK